MSDQADIVERLGDLARFYLNEKPDDPISQEEREEIASELSSAAAEITRLRGLLRQAHCVIAHGPASGLAWEYTLDNIDDALNRPRFTECNAMLAKKLAGSSE